MKRSDEHYLVIMAVLCAVVVAAHTHEPNGFSSPLYTYGYSLARVGVQCLLFVAARTLIEKYWANASFPSVTAAAIAASHIPYVLSVTALDIAAGIPELGLEPGAPNVAPPTSALLWELVYLLDNQIGICLLLSVPRWLRSQASEQPEGATPVGATPITLLSVIEPPLRGNLLWVEAQEHYVRLTTTEERRMVLARFSDIVRELNDRPGMQVHRSHWIARDAVANLTRSGQNVMLELSTGDTVPVSRSFRQRVEAELAAEPQDSTAA